MKWRLACSLVILPGILNLTAADWPQWRGPNRNGVSTEKLSSAWPTAGPRVLWQATVGRGFSGISVSHGRACTLGNTNEQDEVWCFDAVSGQLRWKHTYPARLNPQYYEGGPGATPTFDGEQVITLSKWGDVFCFDAAKGTVLWQRNLRQDGFRTNRWGFAGSPLIYGDLILLNVGSAGLALDRHTGQTVWQNGTGPAGYASPEIFGKGSDEVVLVFASKELVALDPKTGRERWRYPWVTNYDTNNTDPIPHLNTLLISSYNRGCALLAVREGKPELVYASKALHNHLSPGIVIGDYLYAFHGEAKTKTDFRCLHLPSGQVQWTVSDPEFGSLLNAGGQLLILSEKGQLLLGDASPTGFKILSRAQVLEGVCWTPPTLANGLVYVRNAAGLVRCLDLKAR